MAEKMADAKENLSIIQKYLLSLSPHNPQWQSQMYEIAEECEEEEEASNDTEEVEPSHDTGSSCTGVNYPRPPIAIILTPTAGRQMVASRNIKPGEILLREPAFLPLVPPSSADADLRPTCVGCLAQLPDEGYAQCKGCGAPQCTNDCSFSGHSKDECHILERLEMKTKEDPSDKLEAVKKCTALLIVLRVVQEMESRPHIKDVLWSMEANVTLRSKIPKGWQRERKILSDLRDNLQMNVDEDTVFRICGLYDTNAFQVPASESHSSRCRAFFPAGGMMNHSCVPNAQEWFTDNVMIVRAAREISKGSAVTINYTKILWGTRLRRDFLMHTKFFVCGCLRCRDPTELGSHLSSLRCNKCSGMVVPPVGHSDKKSPWRCTGCKIVLPGPNAQTIMIAASVRYSKVNCRNEESLKSAFTTLERAIGPQHFIAIDLRYKFIKLMNKKRSELTVNELQSLVQMIKNFLGVIQLIVPEMSTFRGMAILYYVQAASQLLQRNTNTKTSSYSPSVNQNKGAFDVLNTEDLMNNNGNGITQEKALDTRRPVNEDVLSKPSDQNDPLILQSNNNNIDNAEVDSYSGIKNITVKDLIELTEESQRILLYSKKHQIEVTDALAILTNMLKKKSS